MSNSKYEITDIAHKTYPFLHRIRALQDIGDWAKAGDLGGFVESESNLAVDRMTLPGSSMTRSPAAAPMWTRTQF